MSLTWVILCGGRGSRLGGIDKSLLTGPDGRTLLEATLSAAGTAPILLVAPKAKHSQLAAVAPQAPLVDDPGEGPAVALWAALPEVRTDWLALLAVDHPRPSQALIERLERAAVGRDGALVVAGRDQPVPGVYRRAAFTRPARSLQALLAYLSLARLEVESLGPEERAALEDVDLPEDLHRLGVRLAPGAGPLKD